MRRLLLALSLVLLTACGLPVNEHPKFDSPDEADLDPDALVLGVELNGQARAYPIEALAPLEILNDTLAGRPVAITWCPLSASSAVFERRVDDQELTLRFHPDLYKFNLIVEDLETHTRWCQLTKGAIAGELEGTPLPLLPSLQTTWDYWYDLHPNTLVMRPTWGGHTFHYRDPGEPGPDGLPPKSLTHVVWVKGDARAYPLRELETLPDVLDDDVGGVPVRVRHIPAGPTAAVTLQDGTPVAGITLYHEYVPEFYPDARLWRLGQDRPLAASGNAPATGTERPSTPGQDPSKDAQVPLTGNVAR